MIKIALGEDVFENYIDNSQKYIDKSLFIGLKSKIADIYKENRDVIDILEAE